MKIKKTLLIILPVLIFNIQSFAQCAMCKAVATSTQDGGGDIGRGLNNGIYILMAFPYILLMTGGYFFFKKQVDTKLKEWKERFFSSSRMH